MTNPPAIAREPRQYVIERTRARMDSTPSTEIVGIVDARTALDALEKLETIGEPARDGDSFIVYIVTLAVNVRRRGGKWIP